MPSSSVEFRVAESEFREDQASRAQKAVLSRTAEEPHEQKAKNLAALSPPIGLSWKRESITLALYFQNLRDLVDSGEQDA